MPCRPAGQLLAFKQHDIVPANLGEVIGNRTTDNTATDNDDLRLFGEFSHEITPSFLRYRDHRPGAPALFQRAVRPAA